MASWILYRAFTSHMVVIIVDIIMDQENIRIIATDMITITGMITDTITGMITGMIMVMITDTTTTTITMKNMDTIITITTTEKKNISMTTDMIMTKNEIT